VAYQRNNFLFYGSFREVTKEIDDPMVRLEIYEAIIDYSLYGEEPAQLSQLAAIVFKAIKPVMQTQRTNSENGTKGGLSKKKKPASDNSESPLPENEKARLQESEKPASENSESYRREKIEDRREKIENSKEKREDNTLMSGKPDDAQTAPAEVAQIIDTLNLVLGTHYKSTTPKTVKLIHDRLKEGFTVSDFEIVIRKMFRVWTGTEYEKFLRPETLFGTKFESYLNRTDTTDREIEAEKGKDRFRALYEWAARKEAERKETETNDGDGFCADSGEDTCYLPDFSSC